jgi:hypothetical protein
MLRKVPRNDKIFQLLFYVGIYLENLCIISGFRGRNGENARMIKYFQGKFQYEKVPGKFYHFHVLFLIFSMV